MVQVSGDLYCKGFSLAVNSRFLDKAWRPCLPVLNKPLRKYELGDSEEWDACLPTDFGVTRQL